MEEKNKDALSFLDKTAKEIEQKKNEKWSKTIDIKVEIGVRIVDQKPSRRCKRKHREQHLLGYSRLVLYSQDPLWSLLDNDSCSLLPVLNSSKTYTRYPQRELRIISAHQELSERECIGSVMAYHKEQLVSQALWHLTLSGGVVRLKLTLPYAIAARIVPEVRDWSDWD